jgi:hypothetical protein
MRYFFKLFFFLSFPFLSFAQNGVNVAAIVSPLPGANYDSNAVVDITIRIINDGPNNIVNNDTLLLDLTIANPDTTEFYNYRIRTNAFFFEGDVKEYTLINSYHFKKAHNYSICATIQGTTQFPINQTKNARKCVSFIVGLNSAELPEILKARHQDGQLIFNSSSKGDARIQFFDIGGKLLN